MEVKIKTETLPTRCEICHQSDLFDPNSNHCARCAGVPQTVNQSATAEAPRSANSKATITDIELGATVGMILGLFIGIIGGYLATGDPAFALVLGFINGMPVWLIHGGIVGLFVGESAQITNAAEIGAISKALQTSPSMPAREQTHLLARLKAIYQTFRGPLIGLILGAIPGLILTWLQDEVFIWATVNRVLIWTLCGLLNGTIINILCRRRSDRRNKPYLVEEPQS